MPAIGNAGLLEILALAIAVVMTLYTWRGLGRTVRATRAILRNEDGSFAQPEKRVARRAVRREAVRLVTFLGFGAAAAIGFALPSQTTPENEVLGGLFWAALIVSFGAHVINVYLDSRF